MNTCVENTQEMPEKLCENEMQLESASDLLILDIEKNQNDGTVVHTKYGDSEGRCGGRSWKTIPGERILNY